MGNSPYTMFVKRMREENGWNLRSNSKQISEAWKKEKAKTIGLTETEKAKLNVVAEKIKKNKGVKEMKIIPSKEELKIAMFGKPKPKPMQELKQEVQEEETVFYEEYSEEPHNNSLREMKYNTTKDLSEKLPLNKRIESQVKSSVYETELKAVVQELTSVKEEYVNQAYDIIRSDFSRRLVVVQSENTELKRQNAQLYNEVQALKQRLALVQEKLGKAKQVLGEL